MSYLEKLLGLQDLAEFLKTYLKKAPYFYEGEGPHSILDMSLEDVLAIIDREEKGLHDLEVKLEGKNADPSLYYEKISEDKLGRPDSRLIMELVTKHGASIHVKRAHEKREDLTTVCHTLARDIKMSVGIILIYSPPGCSSLPPHYDDFDVIILQLQGSKLWSLMGDNSSIGNPPKFGPELDVPENVAAQIAMKEGNLLYMPPGLWHCAKCGSEGSLHAAIGIRPFPT